MSKLGVAKWAANDVYDPRFEELKLWHYYRASDFSEHKDGVEQELFFQGRNLFNQSVDLVFFDTTSVYFEGPTGAQGLCCYGYSKDKRPDRMQVIIGLLIDRDGIPIGHEVLPGNTADEVALAYKQLWLVERAFRKLKSNLEIRPMYHWTESRIRGHIMVCFLAFYLEMVLRKRLKEVACDASYTQVLKDLSRVRATKIVNGKRVVIVRSELGGDAHLAFKTARMQVPNRVLYENAGHHR